MKYEELIDKLSNCENQTEKLYLHGKLIKLLKQMEKEEKDPNKKVQLRVELYKELKEHKNIIASNSLDENCTISNKVALKIKDIANSIDIFKEKYDVIGKVKKAGGGAVASITLASLLTVATTVLSGGSLTLPTLAALLPTASYIGLSSILKIPFDKTNFSDLLKEIDNNPKISAEEKDFFKTNVIDNKEYAALIKKKSECKNTMDLINVDEQLLVEMKRLTDLTPTEGTKFLFNSETVNLMTELKKKYEEIKRDYSKDKINISEKELADINKKILKMDVDIFKYSNYLKETGKETVKNFGVNTATMYAARIALGAIFPGMQIKNVADAIIPLLYSVAGNIANISDIKNGIKMKETKYRNSYIRLNNDNITNINDINSSVSRRAA